MEDFLEFAFDKFIFRTKVGYWYSRDEFWADVQGGLATVGLTDFLQKSMGDVTFLETVKPGTQAEKGKEIGSVETIKVAFGIISPVTGKVLEVNPELEMSPERINSDPYGAGWVYKIELAPSEDLGELIPAGGYMELLKEKVKKEARGV